MAKPLKTSYFAVKLVAPTVGAKKMFVDSSSLEGTVPVTQDSSGGEALMAMGASVGHSLQIGTGRTSSYNGVAGHFNAVVFHFSTAESAKCKTTAEAERLVKTKHKDWLANAYDWFVVPANTFALPAGAAPAAKAKRAKKI